MVNGKLAKQKILVVEDDFTSQELFKLLLGRQ